MREVICQNQTCKKSFVVTAEDIAAVQRYGVDSLPPFCTECRHQQRVAFMAGYVLHKRTSSKSGAALYSVYDANVPFPVYTSDEWWSQDWDPRSYGRSYDPSRNFFDQYEDVFNATPKMSNIVGNCEGSQYAIYAGNSKNVYYSSMVFRNSEDVYFSISITHCTFILDCLRCFNSSSLYECIQCSETHQSAFLFDSHNSRDCFYGIDLRNCSDCILSSNLRNKKFYVRNEFVGEEQFIKIKAQLINGSYKQHMQNLNEWNALISQSFRRDQSQLNCVNSLGHGLLHCNESYECYHSQNLDHGRYCVHVGGYQPNSYSMDITIGGVGEFLYSCCGCGAFNSNLKMCVCCRTSSNLTYCISCYECKDCFGCANLRNAQYCILNKQYSKEEYEQLIPQIIQQMKQQNLWGSFFPKKISPHAYNDSMAMMLYPRSQKEAELSGYRWNSSIDPIPDNVRTSSSLPDNLADLPEDSTKTPLICEHSGRAFKLISKELMLLHSLGLPAPRQHPYFRAAQRMDLLGVSQLKDGFCTTCQIPVKYQPSEYNQNFLCDPCYVSKLAV